MSPYRLSLLQEFWAEYKDLPVNPPASPGRGGEAHFRKATIITGRAFLPFTPSAPGRARHSLMALPPSPLALRSSVCYLKKKKETELRYTSLHTTHIYYVFTSQIRLPLQKIQCKMCPQHESTWIDGCAYFCFVLRIWLIFLTVIFVRTEY